MNKEIWKTIKEYPNYAVSTFGQIKRITKGSGTYIGKILKPFLNRWGYLAVELCFEGKSKRKAVHHLVLETFVSLRPINKEANHINGNKTKNYVTNLEWVTHSENLKHAFKLGLRCNKGEKHSRAKFTNEDIYFIRKLYATKSFLQKDIAKMFKVHESAISAIITKQNWRHI